MSKKAALRATIPNRVAAYVDLCIADLAAACQDTRVEIMEQRLAALEDKLQNLNDRIEALPQFGPALTKRQLRDLLNTPSLREMNSSGN